MSSARGSRYSSVRVWNVVNVYEARSVLKKSPAKLVAFMSVEGIQAWTPRAYDTVPSVEASDRVLPRLLTTRRSRAPCHGTVARRPRPRLLVVPWAAAARVRTAR